jgi:hypothetical protein
MKNSLTVYSYEALAKFWLYGLNQYDYSGLKGILLTKMKKSGKNLKNQEPVKKEGFNYLETSNILIRIERLESLLEDFGDKSNAIDGKMAALFLGVSKRTVDDLAAKDKIDSYHLGSRHLYRPSDLAKYRQSLVEKNRQKDN